MPLQPQKGTHNVCVSQKTKRQSTSNARPTHTIAESDSTKLPEHPMYAIETNSAQPMSVEVKLNEVPVTMEIDTGASLSIMSKHTYQST
jgi:hypothetical protein